MGRHGRVGRPHTGEDLGGGVLLAHQRAGHHAPEADAPVAEILTQPASLLAAYVGQAIIVGGPERGPVRDGPGIALPWEGGVSRRKIIVRRILEACPPARKASCSGIHTGHLRAALSGAERAARVSPASLRCRRPASGLPAGRPCRRAPLPPGSCRSARRPFLRFSPGIRAT